MVVALYNEFSKKLLTNSDCWGLLINCNQYEYDCCLFSSFLPKSYLQKRGFYLLFKHPSVTFIRLPEVYKDCKTPKVNVEELKKCFNPLIIAETLYNGHPEWLPVYIKHEFGLETPFNQNPFTKREFLCKLIDNKLEVLNHTSINDIATRYQLPMRHLLLSLERFPDRLDKVKPILIKLHSDFFYNYEVAQLLFLLDGYVKQFEEKEVDAHSIKLKNFYNSLMQCKAIGENYFDTVFLNYNLQVLDELYINYIAMKNE